MREEIRFLRGKNGIFKGKLGFRKEKRNYLFAR